MVNLHTFLTHGYRLRKRIYVFGSGAEGLSFSPQKHKQKSYKDTTRGRHLQITEASCDGKLTSTSPIWDEIRDNNDRKIFFHFT